MRVLFILSFLFGTAHWCHSQSPRQGQDHALFFAVSNYEDDSLTDLPQPIANARAIAQELKNRYHFQIEVVADPTLSDIQTKLSEYKAKYDSGRLPRDGQLFIFFSGHGVKEYGNGYFLPADADPDQVITTGLPYNIWRPFIDGINCKHILVAVDACYSVTFDPTWKSMGNGDGDRFRRKNELSESERLLANHQQFPSRLFFTSDAQEDVVPGRSNFARKLLDGLANSYSRASFLMAEELFSNYIKKAQPTPNAGDFGRDDVRSNFLFFYKPVNNLNDTRADRTAWQRAQQEKTIAAYRLYLQQHPKGDFRILAEQQLDQLEAEEREIRAWERAKMTNTRQAYQDFITAYPNSLYRQPAEMRRDALPTLRGNTSIPATNNGAYVRPPDNMVLVKGGNFQMGSTEGEDEKPVRSVTLSDYYIGRFEVTFDEYDSFCTATNRDLPDNEDEDGEGGKHPAINVSWLDAVAYCNWLSEQHRYQPVYTFSANTVSANWNANGYRLPTEAEWEFAARSRGANEKWAGTSSENDLTTYGNGLGKGDGFEYTAPVGSLSANDLGLYDMSGNVWEWCWDWKDTYPSTAQTNPTGPENGSRRVLRGGSWSNPPTSLRCVNRRDSRPGRRSFDNLGFRLSRAAP